MIKVRLLAAIFVLTLIASFGALGAGGVSADTVELEVGILSPQGSHTVVGPAAATKGATEAFTNIVTKLRKGSSMLHGITTPFTARMCQ